MMVGRGRFEPRRHADGAVARRKAGVTLIELIMALAALAVILGLTLPLASGLAARFRVGSARDVFVNYLARARAAAVQYGGEARLRIDATAGRFWVEADTGTVGATGVDTLGVVMHVREEYQGVAMMSDRSVLCFDSRGLPFTGGLCEPSDATVVFSRADRADTVRVSLGGTVIR